MLDDFKNKILNMDCIEGMKQLPDKCIDIIIADPPYNISANVKNLVYDSANKLEGMGGAWNITNEKWDSYSISDYMKFSMEWMSEAKRILKDSGSMWIFGTYHNIGMVNVACKSLNLEIINEVIWFKRNAFPNLTGSRLTASHETIIWCYPKRNQKKNEYTFNYEWSKECAFSYDGLKVQGKQMRDIWDIPNNKERSELAYGKHPTQKPLRLLERMLRLSSKQGDTMLTPFAGSGSECCAAKKLNLNYIGFELEQKYIDIANERLNYQEVLSPDLFGYLQ